MKRSGALCVALFTAMLVRTRSWPLQPCQGTNGKIVFTTDRDSEFDREIYVVNPDGSGETR